jgi:hypothetical protein
MASLLKCRFSIGKRRERVNAKAGAGGVFRLVCGRVFARVAEMCPGALPRDRVLTGVGSDIE